MKRRPRTISTCAAAWLANYADGSVLAHKRKQRAKIADFAHEAVSFLRKRIAWLEDSLRVSYARELLLGLLSDSSVNELVPNSAYLRDYAMTLLFDAVMFAAKRMGDHDGVKEIARLKQVWDKADKGKMAESPERTMALKFVRRWQTFQAFAHNLNAKRRAETEAILLAPLRVAAETNNADFLRAVSEAIESRRICHPTHRMTEEGGLPADVTSMGILFKLLGITPSETGEELSSMFDAKEKEFHYARDKKLGRDKPGEAYEANFRKLLRECEMPRPGRGRRKKLSSGTAK